MRPVWLPLTLGVVMVSQPNVLGVARARCARVALLVVSVTIGCDSDHGLPAQGTAGLYERAVELTYREGGDSAGRAAIPLWRELLRAANAEGRIREESANAGNLGYALAQVEELDSAIHYLRIGVNLADEAGTSFNAAGIRITLGDTWLLKADTSAALLAYREALEILEGAPEPDSVLRARAAARILALRKP